MAQAQSDGSRGIAAKTAVPLQEDDRRLTLAEAGILERRPVVKTRDHQHDTAEDATGACQRRRQQGSLHEPLSKRRDEGESRPGKEIAAGEETGRGKGLARHPALPADPGVEQDHRRCRRQHHADHHHDPHGQGDAGFHGTPGTRRDAEDGAERQGATGSHLHAIHIHGRVHLHVRFHAGSGHAHAVDVHGCCQPERVCPGDHRQCGERRCHDCPIPSQQAFKRGVGRHGVSEPRRFRSCAVWRSGRANRRAKLPAARSSRPSRAPPRSGHIRTRAEG